MIELRNVHKIYRMGDETVTALHDVNLSIEDGEFVAVVGPSGSGKSTLLHLMAGLDKPTKGRITVDGKDLSRLKDREISRYRNKEIGLVFQDFHLQQHLTVLENVEIPLMFAGGKKRKETTIQKKAKELLNLVDIGDRLHHRPSEISGGQKQRVAVARAVINKPRILLADEPTGNLDSVTGRDIITLLKQLHKKEDMTLVVVTHDRDIAKYADRIVEIKDGRLIQENKFEKFTR